MSTPKFIVSHNDQQLGPFDEAELKAQWSKGAVQGVDYVYDENKEDWIMVAERFRWAAAGELTETVRVTKKPALTDTVPVMLQIPELTQEIEIEVAPPPVPVKAPAVVVKKVTPAVVVAPAPVVAAAPAPAPGAVTPAPVVEKVATPAPQAVSAIVVPELIIPVIAPAPAPKGVVVEINDGYGEISIDALDAGSHELAMRGDDMPTSKIRLDVLPTEPVAIEWTIANQCEVGQMAVVQLRVIDHRGIPCRHFEDALTVSIDEKRHSVKTIDGVGSFEFTRELVATCTVTVLCEARPTLKAPAKATLEWTPGPAVKLVVDGPTEHQEGIPLKVRVKALDRFGNVARSYRGAVNLEIKAG